MEQGKKAVFSILGLCMRAGKLVSGEFKTKKAVTEQKARLVLVSEQASDNTKKLFSDKCSFYGVPYLFFGTKQELGHCIGKAERSSVAVLDEGFAKNLLGRLENTAEYRGGSKYGESEGL